jgi:hypothetical protein
MLAGSLSADTLLLCGSCAGELNAENSWSALLQIGAPICLVVATTDRTTLPLGVFDVGNHVGAEVQVIHPPPGLILILLSPLAPALCPCSIRNCMPSTPLLINFPLDPPFCIVDACLLRTNFSRGTVPTCRCSMCVHYFSVHFNTCAHCNGNFQKAYTPSS